jgi:hypothetical protein
MMTPGLQKIEELLPSDKTLTNLNVCLSCKGDSSKILKTGLLTPSKRGVAEKLVCYLPRIGR